MHGRVGSFGECVGIRAIGVELDLPVLAFGIANQSKGQATDAATDACCQVAGRRFPGGCRLAAGHLAGRQVIAILDCIKCFFIHRHTTGACDRQRAVLDMDGNGRGAFITIGVSDGVDEHVSGTGGCHAVRIGVIHRVTGGIDGQGAVLASYLSVEIADSRFRNIRPGARADHDIAGTGLVRAHLVVEKDIARYRAALYHAGRVRRCLGHIIDDIDVQRASAGITVQVLGDHGELFADAVGTAAGWVALVVHQGVAVAHHTGRRVVTGHGQGIALRGGDRLWETGCHTIAHYRDATHAQALQAIGRNHLEGALLGQGTFVRCAAVGKVLLVHGQLATLHVEAVEGHRVVEIVHLQRQRRRTGIAVGVLDRVGESLHTGAATAEALEVRIVGVEGVGVGPVGRQHQGAVGTGEGATDHWAARHAISALYVVGQHIAGQLGMLLGRGDGVGVVHRLGHVVDDVHVQGATAGVAVDILGDHGELFADAIGTAAIRMALIVHQGVAVADHPGGRVVAGHRQGIALERGDRLREACRNAVTHHRNPTHAQALQPIGRYDLEGALLGQGTFVRCAAVGKVLLVHGQLATLHVEAVEGHRVVEIVHLQRQRRRTGIAVGVLDRVGESLHTGAATAEALEVRIVGVEGVGVGPVGRQHQGAVGTGEGATDHWAARHAISALHIIGQHIAGQLGMELGRGDGVGVIHRLGHIVANGHIQRPLGHVPIAVADQHREVLAQVIGTRASGMLLGAVERVAVVHHTCGRVVARDGQRVTQCRGDGLAHPGDHTGGDHVDAANAEVEYPVLGHHGEAALLGERRRVAGRTLRQVGLVEGQLAWAQIQPLQADGMVRAGLRRGWRLYVVVAVAGVEAADFAAGEFRNAIEPGSGETDLRVHAAAHFAQHHEAVATTLATRGATAGGACGSRLGDLAGVLAGGDGLLEFLDIAELRVSGGQVGGLHMRCLVGQLVAAHLQAAVAAQGQFAAVVQMDRHGTSSTGFYLLARVYPITLHQGSTAAVAADREHLANHLANHTDQLSHDLTPPLTNGFSHSVDKGGNGGVDRFASVSKTRHLTTEISTLAIVEVSSDRSSMPIFCRQKPLLPAYPCP